MEITELKDNAAGAESKQPDAADDASPASAAGKARPAEVGGRDGPDPTRFGDWEKNGRCIDF